MMEIYSENTLYLKLIQLTAVESVVNPFRHPLFINPAAIAAVTTTSGGLNLWLQGGARFVVEESLEEFEAKLREGELSYGV
jgi:hypothetical protein